MAALHHGVVGRGPGVEMLAAEAHRLLGDPRLADRHGVLDLEGVADEGGGGGQRPGAVAGQREGLAEGGEVNEVIAPGRIGKELVGTGTLPGRKAL